MEFSQEIYERIEQYLDGQLKGHALQDFERQIAANKALATEVAFQREMQQFLAETPENDLRKNLQALGDQYKESTQEEKKSFWWWLLPNGVMPSFDFLTEKPPIYLMGAMAVLLLISWWFVPKRTSVSANPSIAILPFEDLNTQKNQVYLGYGIAEELLNTLTQLPVLKVAGQTVAFSLQGKDLAASAIGKALNVSHVLKGRVQKKNGKIKVTAQLLTTVDGQQVWSDKYEREVKELYMVKEELLQEVVSALLKKIVPEQQAKLTTLKPQTGEVYDLFLQAKHWHKNIYKSSNDLADFFKSEALFKKAIEIDPNYAPARAGLADLYDSYWVQIQLQVDNTDKEKYEELMEQESQLAFNLTPENAYVNRVRGYVLQHLNQPATAFQSFLKSYKISPKNPESIMGLSNWYLAMGLHEDALLLAEKAKDLDSLFKSAWVMRIVANFNLSQWQKTVDVCQAFLKIDPANQTALEYLFRSYFYLNQREKALKTLAKITTSELLGLDLEVGLLKENTNYIQTQLDSDNPNLAFSIYNYQGDQEKATAAYQQATLAYLNDLPSTTTLPTTLYLNFINNPQLKDFQSSEWFKKVVAVEKEKYDDLKEQYPNADNILANNH